MSKQPLQNRMPRTALKALPLMLLGVLLLVGQLSNLSHARPLPLSEPTAMVSCQPDMEAGCHALMQDDCCDDRLNDCVIKCAQGTLWIEMLPMQLALIQARAIPPPAEQHLIDQPPEQPYQPPRLSAA